MLFLYGCNKAQDVKVEQEKITVRCEGTRYVESENHNGKEKYQTKRTTSFVFTKGSKSDGWSFNEAGGTNIFNMNYEYLDQPGKPKADTRFYVDEQVIKFQQYFWQTLDDKQSQATTSDWEITMNRITGEWYERRNNDLVWTDGTKLKESFTTIGKCENAAQKF